MSKKAWQLIFLLTAIFLTAVFVWPTMKSDQTGVVSSLSRDLTQSVNINGHDDTANEIYYSTNNEIQNEEVIDDSEKSVAGEAVRNDEELFLVSRVIDGDTIELETGERVRYIGINTPEITKGKNECFSTEAWQKNQQLVADKYVSLEKDVSETDKYGRLLRYVWLDEMMINKYLVEIGYAQVATYPPDVKYQSLFLAAQREARASKIGLWGNVCDSQQKTINSQQPTSDCVIKGNISSSDEKIYHLPGCDYYQQTYIDLNRGEKWFCSEEEAQNAGWRKAKNCP